MKRILPLVEVEWHDAHSAEHHTTWTKFSDFRDQDAKSPFLCNSVGYVVFEAADRIALVGSIALHSDGTEDAQVSGTIVIPKSCIVSRKDFK